MSRFASLPAMRSIALEVILRAVFGVEDVARNAPLRRRARADAGGHDAPLALPRPAPCTAPRSLRARMATSQPADAARRQAVVRRDRAQARQAGGADRDDILSLLIGARDERGEPLSDEHLRDELMTMLVAGHETTATALAWASSGSRAAPRRSTASRRRWTRARTPTWMRPPPRPLRIRPGGPVCAPRADRAV